MKKLLTLGFCFSLMLHQTSFGEDNIVTALNGAIIKHNEIMQIQHNLSMAPQSEQETINVFTKYVEQSQAELAPKIAALKDQLGSFKHEKKVSIVMEIAINEIVDPEKLFEKIFAPNTAIYLAYYFLYHGMHLKKNITNSLELDGIIAQCCKIIDRMNKITSKYNVTMPSDLFSYDISQALAEESKAFTNIVNNITNKNQQIILLGHLFDRFRPSAHEFIASHFPQNVQRYFLLNVAA